MLNRRDFVRTASVVSIFSAVEQIERTLSYSRQLASELQTKAVTPQALAADEQFWGQVRRSYGLNPNVVYLDHGWTNPTTLEATAELVSGARALEALPAEELSRLFFGESKELRTVLGEIMGVPAAEIALVRNATEAINTVLLGLHLQSGDEIVCSVHDYFAMLDALEQRRARDGVVLRMVRPSVPAPSLSALAKLYEAEIGARTKLVLLTSPSNLTGQLLPVQRIAAAAHRAGAEVLVDGAQSLGVHEEPISALGCDYYGASAHKWLGTPVGLGVLWMRQTNVPKVWPLVPPPPNVRGMRRFEWIGTVPAYLHAAALSALALHRSLGSRRKAARLRYLSSYLRRKASDVVPDARFYTLANPNMSVGINTVELPGVNSDALQKQLRDRHHVLTQSMAGNSRAPEIAGLRITPNVYTRIDELDLLVRALGQAKS
jgi:selenocysteine lyase/cysteine desulfurase